MEPHAWWFQCHERTCSPCPSTYTLYITLLKHCRVVLFQEWLQIGVVDITTIMHTHSTEYSEVKSVKTKQFGCSSLMVPSIGCISWNRCKMVRSCSLWLLREARGKYTQSLQQKHPSTTSTRAIICSSDMKAEMSWCIPQSQHNCGLFQWIRRTLMNILPKNVLILRGWQASLLPRMHWQGGLQTCKAACSLIGTI